MPIQVTYPGLILFAYLLGSIPWGLVLTRMFTSHELRRAGSGNIGATNVLRVAGVFLGILTLAGDILKGAIPVYLSLTVPDGGAALTMAVAASAFLGHLYPVFLKFRNGGKGVATAAGCFVVISPMACLTVVLVFFLVTLLTNHVSVGSMAAAALLPVSVFLFTQSWHLALFAGVMGGMIILRHRENIKRLRAGTEPGVRKKKK